MSWMLGPLREGIMTILIVAGPIILAAAAVGLLIGILQAATQIQDQTIPSALKLIGVMLLLVFMGMWMFTYITNFTQKTIGRAFTMVISNRNPVLQPDKNGSSQAQAAVFRPQAVLGAPNLPFSPVSGNSSFQATLAPPVQSFSNAMQTAAPPSNYYYAPSSQNTPLPPQYAGQMQAGGYNNYQAPQNPVQAPGQQPMQNYNQAAVAPSQPSVTVNTQSAPKPKRSGYSSNTTSSNQRALSYEQPAPIRRPVLPGSLDSTINIDNSSNGDPLMPPARNKVELQPANGSGVNSESNTAWW